MTYDIKAKVGLAMVVASFAGLLAYGFLATRNAAAKPGEITVSVPANVVANRMDSKSGHCRYLNTVDEAAERATLTPALSELMQVDMDEPQDRHSRAGGCGVVVEFEYQKQRYRLPQLLSVSGGSTVHDVVVRDAGPGRIYVKLSGRGELPAVHLGPAT